MPSKKGSVKVAYDFSPEAKYNLTTLKAELRFKGIPATETGILEVLLNEADAETLVRPYREYLGK